MENTDPAATYTFRCRPSIDGLFALCGIFGVVTALCIWGALNVDQGVIFKGIQFSPEAVKTISWASGGIMLLMTLFVGWSIKKFGATPPIAVSPEAIEIHLGLPPKRLRVPLSRIVAVSRQQRNGEDYLLLHTANRPLQIAVKWLDSQASSADLEALIRTRLDKSQG